MRVFGAVVSDGTAPLIVNEPAEHFFLACTPLKEAAEPDAFASLWAFRFPAGVDLSERGVERYVDALAGGKLTHLFINVNYQRSYFPSKTIEPVWTSIDEPGSNPTWFYRDMRDAFARGLDVYAVMIRRCRERQVSPWISFRMNDIHGVAKDTPADVCAFWREHPEYHLKRDGKWNWANGFDYAQKPVRDRMCAYIREALERYDADGVELDFLRFPCYFREGEERKSAPILTAFVREIHAICDATAKRRGHPVKIAARMTHELEKAVASGMDAGVWSREGLIDMLIVCNMFGSIEYEYPLDAWRKLVGDRVALVAGTDNGIRVNERRRVLNLGEYRHWMDTMRRKGADGCYFFNFALRPFRDETWRGLVGEAPTEAITIGPGDSLAAAVERARRTGVWTIRLKGGVYPVTETVALDQRDNGLEIVAAAGETPVLDGGIALRNGEKTDDGFVSYDLAAAGFPDPKISFKPFGMGIKDPAQLMVYRDGAALTEAREPNDDFTGVTEVLDASNFVFRANLPLAEKLVGAKGLVAHGYYTHGWADYTLPAEISRDEKGVVFRLGSLEVLPAWGHLLREGRPFRLYGSKLFLDRDDEWFYDRAAGRIWMRATADAKGAPVVAAMNGPFLKVDGTKGLVVRGVTFRCGRGCAVVADKTEGLVFERNVVEKFGLNGVVATNATRARFSRNTFRTFGSSGLVLKGGDRKTLTRGDNLVVDCDFSDGGRIVRSGSHVLMTHGVGNVFLHNRFHDLPGAAVRFDGNDHLFASNVIERCVLEADDWGGIENYGSPFYRGSKIVHNVFRNIGGVSKWNYCGQCGVRFDDAISGMYVYGNRFDNASRGCFGGVQVHGGKGNVIENNLFTGCNTALSVTTWSRENWLNKWNLAYEREKDVMPLSETWRKAYGDAVLKLKDEPARETMRRNVIVGGEGLVRYNGPSDRVEVVQDGNVCLPAGADWTAVKDFDPLPSEDSLGVRKE